MEKNNDQKYSANTSGEVWYGRDREYEKALSIRYFDNRMVLGIHGVLPDKMRTTKAKYDYKGGTLAYLNGRIAKQLAKDLQKIRDKMLAGDTDIKSRAVPYGSKTLVEVGPGSAYGCNENSVCVSIYTLSPEGKSSTACDTFEFNSQVSLVGYKMDGTYDVETNDMDVEHFIENLKEFAKASTCASSHFVKKELKYTLDRGMRNQLQIMSSLGISADAARTRTDWNSGNSNQGNQTTYNQTSSNELANELSGYL